MIHIGIDPGITGGICEIDHSIRSVVFFDTPTVQIKSGKTLKNTLNIPECVLVLQALSSGRNVHVTIEKVNAMPPRAAKIQRDGSFVPEFRSMGVTSAFNFGKGYGIWLGILSALFIPFDEVAPVTWKKSMMSDMGKEKDASRIKAMQLYPETASDLKLKKHHGRADALLIAEYGRKNHF